MKIINNEVDNIKVFEAVYGEDKEGAVDLSGNLYMDVNALVLTEGEHSRILKAQEDVTNLFKDMEKIVQASPELLEWLGIPENLWEDVVKKKISNLTSYGRFDWMVDKDGSLQLLEFNAETPFGWKEAIDYQDSLHHLSFNLLNNPNKTIKCKLKNSIYKSLEEQGYSHDDKIAIIGDIMDQEEHDTFKIMKEATELFCNDVVIDSVVNLKALDNEIYLHDGYLLHPVDFLQTFYSCEWLAEDDGAEDLINALRTDKVKLINPSSTLILHSKGLFALIWFLYTEENMLKEHSQTIESYIPYTSFLETEFNNIYKFVAKPLNHREGDGVEIRNKVTGVEEDNIIYQDYIDSVELEYPLSDKYFNRKNELLKPTIGTFIIDNEFGGYYTRLSKEICSSKFAVFTPTFID